MKIHPLHIIVAGFLILSLGFNILLYVDNQDLIKKIQQKPKVIIIPIVPKKQGTFTSKGVSAIQPRSERNR
jgi:hypothetical protein